MPQALKPLSLIHIGKGKISQLPLLALWGNKNWLPSMKVKELEIFQNKSGLKGCKWSSLKAPGTETQAFHFGNDESRKTQNAGLIQKEGWVVLHPLSGFSSLVSQAGGPERETRSLVFATRPSF